ncbi:testis-expressed sequence 2 protein-like isoform X1 [Panicum miliaceum]|uniref:Testis-expressed sequence 2 protein-like isoform X1 n=1 Tax=Panicum miliaceum TaxID=4540 RepID=A0A3L6PG05_PANMI|nr:testis-expressed sequence 2 protein-like isoform X1 [Panicum miliaceum]
MAVALLLLGFLLGVLSLAIAEGAALLWAMRSLRRRPSPPSRDHVHPPPPPPELKRQVVAPTRFNQFSSLSKQSNLYAFQGFLWMLGHEKMPKVSTTNCPSNGASQGIKEKKTIVEVFPVKMLAKLEGHSLTLSAPDDGSQQTIHLLNSTVVAVSASNLPSRKWAKRYPIKLESKESEICRGSKDIKQPGTPSSSASSNSQLYDSPHTNVEEKLANDGTLCWNLLFSRLFFDAKMNDEVSKAIKARIQRTLSNTRTPAYIGEITLAGLSLGKLPPYLHRMRVLPLDLNEMWAFEVDFEYSSGILLHIETRLEIWEPELEKDIMRTSLKDDSNGDMGLDVLDSIEQYGNQLRPSEALDSVVNDNDETDALMKSKSTGWTSTYMSRWKRILHSIADQVSQVPLSLAIKISCVRGTMRIHIKPPPSDRIWYGFTSMPELEWELESSVGDRKITNNHIASLISNRIKASLHQSLVLPNCESIPISWMLSDTDDWVPRKIAPFIWLNREPPTETTARPTAGTTRELPGEASVSKAIAKNKSSPPASSTRSKTESSKKTKICVDGSEQAEASTSWLSRLVAASEAPLQYSEDATRDLLRMSLMSSSRDDRAVVVAAGTSASEEAEDVKRKRSGLLG